MLSIRISAAQPAKACGFWTSRPYFKEHPEVAIKLLSALKADDSEYARKSTGNALRDISKQFPELVQKELAMWDTTDKRIEFTRKLAGQFLGNDSKQTKLPSAEPGSAMDKFNNALRKIVAVPKKDIRGK